VDELADFSLTKNSAVVISDAVHELARRSDKAKVGLLGLSFAGSMSLIAASDPAVARQLSVVISIGGDDNLRRVLEFYQTDQATAPDGTVLRMKANDYGILVMAYGHASAFFSPADVQQARRALHSMLEDKAGEAYAEAAKLSPEGQQRMKQLFTDDAKALEPEIQRNLDAEEPELKAASPHFYISHLQVPVLLLHGATDDVVPSTEMLWLEHDLPPGTVKGALISGAVGHVDLENVSWTERWRLVEWIRKMLGLLDTGNAAQTGSAG
jgi:pimeloyl-ACP methyl ester carboxylesterase